MSLFNYDNCSICSSNNSSCDRCKLIEEIETKFEMRRHIPDPDYSDIELRLQCISRLPLGIHLDAGKLQNRIKDVNTHIFDNVDDDNLRPVMKSFIRKNWGDFRMGVVYLGFKKDLEKEFAYTKHTMFQYRKRMYPINILLKIILYEYLMYQLRDFIDYVEISYIQQYLDDVFDE